MSENKKKVSYYYDENIGNFYYGINHPMKPQRIRLTNKLVIAYELYKKMKIFRPFLVNTEEIKNFHSDAYIRFLQKVNLENEHILPKEVERFNVDIDCPIFDGLWKFCQISVGGSIGCAYQLNEKIADITINWAGGLHHAKKSEASGFCYVNDSVLAIIELLKRHQRVLYIDIDIHHCDGVEEAFYTTDRVLTVSFHKYGNFFPGTGSIKDIGLEGGQNYSLNFPLEDGIDDKSFQFVFQPLITEVISSYQPDVIVIQCGADSLSGDRLGSFNLTIKGHGECIKFIKKFGLSLMILGGGGYTIHNVARCWAYETALCVNIDLPDQIPFTEYNFYFAPYYRLQIEASNITNKNTKYNLEKKLHQLTERIKRLPHAPGVQMKEMEYLLGKKPKFLKFDLEQKNIQKDESRKI